MPNSFLHVAAVLASRLFWGSVKPFFVKVTAMAMPTTITLDDTWSEADLEPIQGPVGGAHLQQVSGQEAVQASRTVCCKVCKCSSQEDCVFVLCYYYYYYYYDYY